MPDTTHQLIGIIQRQPTDPNFLHQHRFRLVLHRIPNVLYFMQEVNLPGISMGNAIQPTPFTDIPVHGDKVQFEDLVINFAIDEQMKNYLEIFHWMSGLGFPESFDQHAELLRTGGGRTSDMMLMILDSNYQPSRYVMFRGAFPVSLSGLQFNTKETDTTVLTSTVTFKYAYYHFIDMNNVTG